MTEKQVFILAHDTARSRAEQAVRNAPAGYVVEVKQRNRNTDQNALLHALLGEIAEQKQWAGQKWDTESWKRLLTAAWMRTRAESVQMVPAVDGHGFEALYRRTSTLTKGECAELIDFIQAWAVDQGIRFHEHEPA